MAIPFLNNINLSGNEVQNFVVQPLATNPTTLVSVGRKFFNSAEGRESIYDGVAWKLTAYMGDIIALQSSTGQIDTRLAAIESYFSTSEDAGTQIDKWNEIVAFLNATEGDTLSSILSSYVLQTRKFSGDGTTITGGGDMTQDRTFSLAASGVTVGTYTKVTVDKYGRVTTGATLTAADIPTLAIAKIDGLQEILEDNASNIQKNFRAIEALNDNKADKGTTLEDYGITDAYTREEVNTELAKYLLLESPNQTIKGNITIEGNLVVTGDTSSGAKGTDSGTSGTLIGIKVNDNTYAESYTTNGILDLSDAFNNITIDTSTLQPLITVDNKLPYSLISDTPTLGRVALTNSYSDLNDKPTIATFMGSTAVGGVKSYAYWTGTQWSSKALGELAFLDSLSKSDVGLGNVENTALSTWAGTNKITTLGTITTGTWQGSKITNAYLANSKVTIAGTDVSLGGSITKDTLLTNLGLTAAAKKYATAITKGTATEYTITHSLNTKDVVVMVYDPTTNEKVMVDVTMTTVNAVKISFGSAPTQNYRVVVVG